MYVEEEQGNDDDGDDKEKEEANEEIWREGGKEGSLTNELRIAMKAFYFR